MKSAKTLTTAQIAWDYIIFGRATIDFWIVLNLDRWLNLRYIVASNRSKPLAYDVDRGN